MHSSQTNDIIFIARSDNSFHNMYVVLILFIIPCLQLHRSLKITSPQYPLLLPIE
jgi:hypothetical protein